MKSDVIESIIPVVLSNKRPKRRIALYILIIIWILGINYWIIQYKQDYSNKSNNTSIYESFDDENTNNDNNNNNNNINDNNKLIDNISIQLYHKHTGVKDVRGPFDSHSTNYDYIFKNHDINSVLSDLSFGERCDLYFNNLYNQDINWYLNPNKDFYFEMRHSFAFEKFRNDKLNEAKDELANEHNIDKDKMEVNADVEERIKAKFNDFWSKTQNSEQGMTDYVSHLRIFNKCYITSDNQFQSNQQNKFINNQKKFVNALVKTSPDSKNFSERSKFKSTLEENLLNTNSIDSCLHLEKRIYPWLSFSFPIFERWTGDILYSPPNYRDYVKHSIVFEPTNSNLHNGKGKANVKSKLTNGKSCFLNDFKNSMNSKGIVLSIGNQHVDDTVKLLHLLRALNNKYPIQIVYNENLTKESKRKLVHAARDQFSALPKSFEKIYQFFPDDYLDEMDGGLPKQEIWFVNVNNVIHDNYKNKFDKFANKFLAAQFNSFEEYILIDADTVLVQNPQFFFNLKGYVNKGAYFYKDRTAPEFRPISDINFFKKLSPSLIDSAMFDIPIITKHTINLEFFDGMGHFMESGLVVIDRNQHFNSILMMIQLNFFKAVTQRVYGDKEIFWLAFAINGDENYQFNKYFTAAIGEETPMDHRLKSNGKPKFSHEICSAHPGHINGEDGKSLVWFNSGFKFCGQSDVVNYDEEFNRKSRLKFLKSKEEMKIYFQNPLILKHAVIPPFKNKLETLCDNLVEEPNQGWIMDRGYCNSYLWCAYSSIGGTTSDGSDNTQIGQFIEFDERVTDLFKYYGDIWIDYE